MTREVPARGAGENAPAAPTRRRWRNGGSTQAARTPRRASTPAEALLWRALRDRSLCGAKVRRQAPCGPWTLDLLFASARLVVELDGDTHATPYAVTRDARRDAWLAERGYEVLRFTNRDVLGNLDGVLAVILAALARRGPADPSRSHTDPVG